MPRTNQAWKARCKNQGKDLRKGFHLPDQCIPKAGMNLSESERKRISNLNKTDCNKLNNAYFRQDTWVPRTCSKPNVMPSVHGEMMTMWNKVVSGRVAEACPKEDGKVPTNMIKYCRMAANTVRQDRLGKAVISKMNTYSAKVKKGQMTAESALKTFKAKALSDNALRGLPKIGMNDAKLLYEQRKDFKSGKIREEKTVTQLRKQ